jgi:quercetin dioxygenase-like cupin family protein
MNKPNVRRLLSAAALFALGVGSTLVAQTLTDSPQRVEKQRVDLSGAPGMEVIVSTAEYLPGDTIELHSHHGIEAMYVIQGATVQAPEQPAKAMPTGATAVNLRDVNHAGIKVVGDSSLKLFTVHVVDKDKPLYAYVQ